VSSGQSCSTHSKTGQLLICPAARQIGKPSSPGQPGHRSLTQSPRCAHASGSKSTHRPVDWPPSETPEAPPSVGPPPSGAASARSPASRTADPFVASTAPSAAVSDASPHPNTSHSPTAEAAVFHLPLAASCPPAHLDCTSPSQRRLRATPAPLASRRGDLRNSTRRALRRALATGRGRPPGAPRGRLAPGRWRVPSFEASST